MRARRSLSILSRPRHPGKSKEERPGSSVAVVTASFVPFHHVENARCTCVSSRETTRGSRTEEKTRWEWRTERSREGPREEEGKKKRGIIGEGGRGVTRSKKRRSSVSPEEKLFGSWSLRRRLHVLEEKCLRSWRTFIYTKCIGHFLCSSVTRRVTIRRKRYGEKRGEKKKKKPRAISRFSRSRHVATLFFDPLEFTREINIKN